MLGDATIAKQHGVAVFPVVYFKGIKHLYTNITYRGGTGSELDTGIAITEILILRAACSSVAGSCAISLEWALD